MLLYVRSQLLDANDHQKESIESLQSSSSQMVQCCAHLVQHLGDSDREHAKLKVTDLLEPAVWCKVMPDSCRSLVVKMICFLDYVGESAPREQLVMLTCS